MKKKYGIILCVILFIVCGLIWWFMPVHFLREVEPEEVDSFGIQNPYIMRRDDAFYRCNGELGTVAEHLENLEAIQFPDWNKDPDFPYS